MSKDPEILAHLEWLGFVQPVGLVVSVPALTQAQAYVNKNIIPDHQRFLGCLPDDEDAERRILDFPAFTRTVLGWEAADLLGTHLRLVYAPRGETSGHVTFRVADKGEAGARSSEEGRASKILVALR